MLNYNELNLDRFSYDRLALISWKGGGGVKQGLYGTTQNVDSRVRYHFQLIQSPKPVSEEESQNEVVVESGPVEYEKNDENTQEYDELEEEEEGEPVSVTQLMGHIYDGGKLLPFFLGK